MRKKFVNVNARGGVFFLALEPPLLVLGRLFSTSERFAPRFLKLRTTNSVRERSAFALTKTCDEIHGRLAMRLLFRTLKCRLKKYVYAVFFVGFSNVY